MKTIDVYVASGAETLTINVTTEVPTLQVASPYYEEYRRLYAEQARLLVDEMLRSMPGGLVDAVLVALLEHRRSILRVPHTSQDREPGQ